MWLRDIMADDVRYDIIRHDVIRYREVLLQESKLTADVSPLLLSQ